MTKLFRRAAKITISTIQIVVDPSEPGSHLDVAFNIQRTLKPEPNTAELQIWNLNQSHRSALEQLDKVPVEISAGYEEQTALLYLGYMRTVFSYRDGADIVTSVQSGDGEKEYQQARINVGIAKGTSNHDALRQVAKALGVSTGNLDDPAVVAALAAAPPLFARGSALSGQASQIITELTTSLGIEWSTQNGALQLLPLRQPLAGTAVVLSSNTGLVGVPSVDNKGVLTAQTLLIPDIFPGRILQLDSERLGGIFRVETVNYVGDSAGNDWYINIEAKKL